MKKKMNSNCRMMFWCGFDVFLSGEEMEVNGSSNPSQDCTPSLSRSSRQLVVKMRKNGAEHVYISVFTVHARGFLGPAALIFAWL